MYASIFTTQYNFKIAIIMNCEMNFIIIVFSNYTASDRIFLI